MAATYKAVGWNAHKRIYDLVLVACILGFIAVFVIVEGMYRADRTPITPEISILRALGACAFLMLNLILTIGPLARLSPYFLPLLYNRRHFGVTLFLVALAHAAFAIAWYHGFGVLNPIVSVLTGAGRANGIPFEAFGAGALLILFVMAATSHDFWLANLSPVVWKTLHMLVYAAYGLVLAHVAFGVLQAPGVPNAFAFVVAGGAVVVVALHLIAAIKEWHSDGRVDGDARAEWVDAGLWSEIVENRARTMTLSNGERIAVFRYDGKISAVSNVCAHQLGPLGEGKIVDGCITCPWHGFQYLPETGCSPPPFTEKIATYRVKVDGPRVFVDPKALAPGTPVAPARIGASL